MGLHAPPVSCGAPSPSKQRLKLVRLVLWSGCVPERARRRLCLSRDGRRLPA